MIHIITMFNAYYTSPKLHDHESSTYYVSFFRWIDDLLSINNDRSFIIFSFLPFFLYHLTENEELLIKLS